MVEFERARQTMVDTQLRPGNIIDRRLLSVMGQVPRELFVPEQRRELAYIDEVHPVTFDGDRRYLPAPAPFARLVQLAEVGPDDRVLVVGCGTGYSLAVLAGLAASAVGVESHAALAASAREILQRIGVANAEVVEAPLDAGAPTKAPFDVILIEGAVEHVPEALFDQLEDGGRLVALIRQGATAVAHIYVRAGEDVAGRAEFNATLPALEIVKRSEEFVF